MMAHKIKFLRLHKDAHVPYKATEGSGYHDIVAVEDAQVSHSETTMIRTGLAVELPPGHILDIRPRSGLSKRGYMLVNSPGTIDSDYRHEIMVMLQYIGPMWRAPMIHKGDRVAQCALLKIEDIEFVEVDRLSTTNRKGGFGSTGGIKHADENMGPC